METITALKTSIVFGSGRCSGKLRHTEFKEGRKNCRGLLAKRYDKSVIVTVCCSKWVEVYSFSRLYVYERMLDFVCHH